MIVSMTRRRRIITDVVLVLFSFLNILVIAYYNLRSEAKDCGEVYLMNNCASLGYGSVYEAAGILFGLLYVALLVCILVKSSISLYRSLKPSEYKQ